MSPGWYFLCPTCGQKDNLPFTTLVDWIKKADAESDSSWQHVSSEDAEMESVENSSQATSVQDEASLHEEIQQVEETCNQLGSRVDAWNADGLEEIYRFTSQYIEDSNHDPDAEERVLLRIT